MASREDTHMEQTTHALPAHPRADVRAILKARLADSIDLMPHAKSAHGHVKGSSATWRSLPATAAIAEGKLRVARARGVPVAPRLLVNSEGVPTTQPNDV